MLFRLVHYLPVAHFALAIFAILGAILIMAASVVETAQPGLDMLSPLATVCRWLAISYLVVAALLQIRLSRSGHNLIAQPSRTWVILAAEQILLTVLLIGVLIRGPTSRLQLSGLHHAVAALLVVAIVSLVLAAVDRLAALGVAKTLGDWGDAEDAPDYGRLNAAFIAIAALLFLCVGFLEAQPLPNLATPRNPPEKVTTTIQARERLVASSLR